MKQQTAVQWLAEKMEKLIPPGNQIVISIMIEQAMQMEKKQLLNAYDNVFVDDNGNFLNGEQYYNETYGKE